MLDRKTGGNYHETHAKTPAFFNTPASHHQLQKMDHNTARVI
jgi:hypothetical protein